MRSIFLLICLAMGTNAYCQDRDELSSLIGTTKIFLGQPAESLDFSEHIIADILERKLVYIKTRYTAHNIKIDTHFDSDKVYFNADSFGKVNSIILTIKGRSAAAYLLNKLGSYTQKMSFGWGGSVRSSGLYWDKKTYCVVYSSFDSSCIIYNCDKKSFFKEPLIESLTN